MVGKALDELTSEFTVLALLRYMQVICPGPYTLEYDHTVKNANHPYDLLRINFADENDPEVLMFKLKWL